MVTELAERGFSVRDLLPPCLCCFLSPDFVDTCHYPFCPCRAESEGAGQQHCRRFSVVVVLKVMPSALGFETPCAGAVLTQTFNIPEWVYLAK